MSEGDHLPQEDSFGVQCSKTRLNQVSGEAEPSAFFLKDNDTYFSGAWLEHCGMTAESDQVKEVCRQLIACNRTVTSNHKIAVLKIGATQKIVEENCDCKLDFIHHPITDYESHSGIHGIEQEPMLIAEELAEASSIAPVILT